MAAVAQPAPPLLRRLDTRWIISRGIDLTLINGSAVAGYLYLILFTALHVPASWLWWVWSIGFDGTHIFATVSRTFLDREARARHRALLYCSVAFFFTLGPALVLTGLKPLLYLLVGTWAYYHVIRQHYGFMVLYKVKNRDLGRLDNFLDRVFLGVTTVLPPFHRFLVHHPDELGLPFSFPRLDPALWTILAVTCAAWLARQAQRYRAGDRIDVPKFLLLAAVIPLHWLTFAYLSWQAAVPTVTIVHNLQYHAIVWFHNRNRYASEPRPSGSGGQALAIYRSLAAYLVVGLLFSAAYRIPGFRLGQVSDLAFGFFCGFGLTHYWLDSRIWRVRHDPGLRQALQLG
jgi:hypothetical protein